MHWDKEALQTVGRECFRDAQRATLFSSCWSLTRQVLGHLGFDFEDENGDPVTNPDGGKGALVHCHSNHGTSQYLSWGGASQMSFDVRETALSSLAALCGVM